MSDHFIHIRSEAEVSLTECGGIIRYDDVYDQNDHIIDTDELVRLVDNDEPALWPDVELSADSRYLLGSPSDCQACWHAYSEGH